MTDESLDRAVRNQQSKMTSLFPGKHRRTIFLSGVTGYLGSHLALAFLKEGYRLKVLLRPRSVGPEFRLKQIFGRFHPISLKSFINSRQLEILSGDITEEHLGLPMATISRLSPEITDVLHCAAEVSFDPLKEEELWKVNVNGTKNVLAFTRTMKKAKLHYISTVFVAGKRQGVILEDELGGGGDFNNAYEKSKFYAELEVRKAMRDGLPTVVYRPSILVGDSKTGQTESFIGFYTFLRAFDLIADRTRRFLAPHPAGSRKGLALANNGLIFVPLRILGSESKTLNIIPIDYAVEVIAAIFRDDTNVGRTFHIVNFTPPTIGQLRDWMCQALSLRGVVFALEQEFERNRMNRWERLFASGTKEYTAYMCGKEAIFQSGNTQTLIQREKITFPVTNSDFIQLLSSYCKLNGWGKQRGRGLTAKLASRVKAKISSAGAYRQYY